jgi:uncharacterized protein
MPAENLRIVEQIYQCFAIGDIPGLLALLSPDIEWNEAEGFPYADCNPYRGPDAVLKGVFARVGNEWDGFAAHPRQMIDGGDTVIMFGRYSATHKATGRSMSPQVAHFWTLAGGKVVKFQQLVDTLAVARATGAV